MEEFVDWSQSWRTNTRMMDDADTKVTDQIKDLTQNAWQLFAEIDEQYAEEHTDSATAEMRLSYHKCMAWRRLLDQQS